MNDGPRGRLIAVEGIDGCGKTTQARLLASRLDALYTFEPGATALGAELRRLVLVDGSAPVDDRSEALLMVADRSQHVAEVIEPALAAGRSVVTDRFSASTLAYQGYGRGIDLDELRSIARWAARGLDPDVTVLVDVAVEVAERRMSSESADRIEAGTRAFRSRVADGYRRLAGSNRSAWITVDGSGTVEEVRSQIWSALAPMLGTTGSREPW